MFDELEATVDHNHLPKSREGGSKTKPSSANRSEGAKRSKPHFTYNFRLPGPSVLGYHPLKFTKHELDVGIIKAKQ